MARERIIWVLFITLWGCLGSVVDSLLGGWLQASVVDVRSGKVVEGSGGRKVCLIGMGVLQCRSAVYGTLLTCNPARYLYILRLQRQWASIN